VFSKYVGTRNASPDARGTGVSLALVKAIVDDHGGRIYATSVTGEGSTFTVELPAQNVQPLPHPPQPN
jgi:signal transduction histidine kinase